MTVSEGSPRVRGPALLEPVSFTGPPCFRIRRPVSRQDRGWRPRAAPPEGRLAPAPQGLQRDPPERSRGGDEGGDLRHLMPETPPVLDVTPSRGDAAHGSRGVVGFTSGAAAGQPALSFCTPPGNDRVKGRLSGRSLPRAGRRTVRCAEVGLELCSQVQQGGPADVAGLEDEDIIIEVNGVNVLDEPYETVVDRVQSSGDVVTLLVCGKAAYDHFQAKKIPIVSSMADPLDVPPDSAGGTRAQSEPGSPTATEQVSGGRSASDVT